MSKQLLHPNYKVQHVHPFLWAWGTASQEMSKKREEIMRQCGWSYATFYRKVSNEEMLTEHEASIVARVMAFDINKINEFQNGYKQ